jgi:predicted PurR-regulated permease PerM
MSSAPSPSPYSGLSAFSQQLLVTVMGLISLVFVIHLLRDFAVVLKPLCVAAFLAYLVIPAHLWLVRRGINRPLAAIALIVIVIGLFVGLGVLLYANTETLLLKWPLYEQKWKNITEYMLGTLPQSFRDSMNLHLTDTKTISIELRSFLGSFLGFFSALAVVIVYLVFLLAERSSLPVRLEKAFGEPRATEISNVLATISHAITQYIALKAFISFLGGVGTTIILSIFGVDFALTWGTLAFILNFIPYLGSILATILPTLLALVQLDSVWVPLLIFVLLITMQQLLGTFIEPRMQGTTLGVSPLLIILSLAFWGVVWGVVGMLLAVPLLMVVKIVFENIPATRPVADLMAK